MNEIILNMLKTFFDSVSKSEDKRFTLVQLNNYLDSAVDRKIAILQNAMSTLKTEEERRKLENIIQELEDKDHNVDDSALKQLAKELGVTIEAEGEGTETAADDVYVLNGVVSETLRFPTKALKRRSPTQARKRASVFGEDVFAKKLDSILQENADHDLYYLIDESSGDVLASDFIDSEEMKKRNAALEEKHEPFKWILA